MQQSRFDAATRKTFLVVLIVLMFAALIFGAVYLLDFSRDDGTDETGANSGQAELLVSVLDVAQAQAVVIITPDGHSMLVDASRSRQRVTDLIIPYLNDHGVEKLDYLVLSHPDQDHIGGMPRVLELIPVKAFVDPVIATTNQAYAETLELVLDLGVTPIRARRGTELDMGAEVSVNVLWPPEPLLESGGDPESNNNSVVLQVKYGSTEVLITGDAEEEAELAMVEMERVNGLNSDVLVVGHHGSNSSSSGRFLDAVSPDVGIISAGLDNQYGHPHDEVVQRLRLRGIEIHRTDLEGTIEVRSDGNSYTVIALGTEATP